MGFFVLSLLVVTLFTSAVSPSSQEALPRSFVKRDVPSSYASPSYARESYYPPYRASSRGEQEAEEDDTKFIITLFNQLFGKEKEECGIERLSPPIIIIAIFLGIIMAVSIGVLPPLNIPPIIIPLNGLLMPNLNQLIQPIPIVLPNKGKRAIDDEDEGYYGNFVSSSFDMLTNHVIDVIESEDCAKRLLCETGKYVEGREVLLSLVDFFVPEVYHSGMRVIKDSALEQMNCTSIQCSYIDDDCYQ